MKSNLNSAIATLVLITGSLASAGDNGGGSLNCKSASGRTTLAGGAGANYNGSGAAHVELKVDNVSLKFEEETAIATNSIARVASTIFDPTLKVYTLQFTEVRDQGEYKWNDTLLTLTAHPSTFSKKAKYVYGFKATLLGLDPRNKDQYGYNRLENPIVVDCTIDVGI